ncbi:PilZ domain-containing protein [Paraglaciecola agarilytica]|uniref:PilZ domain-containing protein n=1 Tax=Paraglaciecola chathamensis TaxID=368405 RepID=UPI001C08C99E|nr:PilZ domain-containing protein [Paraglaciecola agarilytica]MBU3018972.1 PilZ domain-containing protein [Paraglaciecola agarilytica]
MSLYHRTSNRAPLALDVRIRHMGKEMGDSCTRNISPFGAFIEMPGPTLSTDDFIEMYFMDEKNDNAYLLQKGLITHCSQEGIGVLFAYDSDEFRQMLHKKMPKKHRSRIFSS